MTDDFRGYGPFQTEAEPTAHPPVHNPPPHASSDPPAEALATDAAPSEAHVRTPIFEGEAPANGSEPSGSTYGPQLSGLPHGVAPGGPLPNAQPTTALSGAAPNEPARRAEPIAPTPHPSAVPHGGASHDGQPHPSAVPHGVAPDDGQPHPSAVPHGGASHDGQPHPSAMPHGVAPDDGQPYGLHGPAYGADPSAPTYHPDPTAPLYAAASSGPPYFPDPNAQPHGSPPPAEPPYGEEPTAGNHGRPLPGGEGYGATTAPDPYGLDPWTSPRPGPRIEPSPPRDRGPIIRGALAGLACGLILFGAGGFLAGRLTTDPQTVPAPAPSAGLSIYEQSQVALNQPKFPATLTAVSQGWLPYLSGCARSGDSGGPALNEGEKTRVRCTLDGMSAIFVEYDTTADRDKARVKALGQNVDARTLTPGVGEATEKASPSGRTNGNYVEYAYKLTEGRAVRTVSGIRWDDAQSPVAGYLLAYWTDGLGSSWAPIRDLWGRYA